MTDTPAARAAERKCRNCNCDLHPAYAARYDGHCLDCANAGVPELKEEYAAALAAKDARIAESCELYKAEKQIWYKQRRELDAEIAALKADIVRYQQITERAEEKAGFRIARIEHAENVLYVTASSKEAEDVAIKIAREDIGEIAGHTLAAIAGITSELASQKLLAEITALKAELEPYRRAARLYDEAMGGESGRAPGGEG